MATMLQLSPHLYFISVTEMLVPLRAVVTRSRKLPGCSGIEMASMVSWMPTSASSACVGDGGG